MNAVPRYRTLRPSGTGVSGSTGETPDLSRRYSRAAGSSVPLPTSKTVPGLGLPPSVTDAPALIRAGLPVKSGSAFTSMSDPAMALTSSRAHPRTFERSDLQSPPAKPAGDGARSLMAEPRSPEGTFAKLTRFRWWRTSSGVPSSVSSASSSGWIRRSAAGSIQASALCPAPCSLSSALRSSPRMVKRSEGSLSMSREVRSRSAISWRHTSLPEKRQEQLMRSLVLSPHMSGIPSDCSLLTNPSSSFPTWSFESAFGSFLSSVRTVSLSSAVKGSRRSTARSNDVVPCHTLISVVRDSLLNDASLTREAFESRIKPVAASPASLTMKRRPNSFLMKLPVLPCGSALFPRFFSSRAPSSSFRASASGSCRGGSAPPRPSFRLMSRPLQRNISVGSFTTARLSSLANTGSSSSGR